MDEWSSPWADNAEGATPVPKPEPGTAPDNASIWGNGDAWETPDEAADFGTWESSYEPPVHSSSFDPWAAEGHQEPNPAWDTPAREERPDSENVNVAAGEYDADNKAESARLKEVTPEQGTPVADDGTYPEAVEGGLEAFEHTLGAEESSKEHSELYDGIPQEHAQVTATEDEELSQPTIRPTAHDGQKDEGSTEPTSSLYSASPSIFDYARDAPTDTPRTSIEGGAPSDEQKDDSDTVQQVAAVDGNDSQDDEFGDFGEAEEAEPMSEGPDPYAKGLLEPISRQHMPADEISSKRSSLSRDRPRFDHDPKLLPALFPRLGISEAQEEASADVIQSVSARKAWYQISRQQTIREVNSGAYENYIRVRWRGSQIQDRTLGIVRRWIQDDMTGPIGTGMGNRKSAAFFGWDRPASQRFSGHFRNNSASPVEAAPAQVSLPSTGRRLSITASAIPVSQLSTPVSKNFNWSSSIPQSPLAQARSSMDHTLAPMTPTTKQADMHSRNTSQGSVTGETPASPLPDIKSSHKPAAATALVTEPLAAEVAKTSPWEALAVFDSVPVAHASPGPRSQPLPLHIQPSLPPTMGQETASQVDEDDDWGEMLQSPPPQSAGFSFPPAATSWAEESAAVSSSKFGTSIDPQPKAHRFPSSSVDFHEDGRIVADILAGIPDLSYMLRR